jgi:formylglycine-generating enzyme
MEATEAELAGLDLDSGGHGLYGIHKRYPEERPVRRVTVDGLWIHRIPMTSRHFKQFCARHRPHR